ncbi:hypothetical protein AHF37_08379 [Paragonimus kellicotti]|nr:hypothetical protein AHF37_08379 [Paragonimus kellicotti]
MAPVLSRARQPLPALPSSSTVIFPDDSSTSAYAPAYAKQQNLFYSSGSRPSAVSGSTSTRPQPRGPAGGHHGVGMRTARNGPSSSIDFSGPQTIHSGRPTYATRGPDNTMVGHGQHGAPDTPPDTEENVYTSEFVLV